MISSGHTTRWKTIARKKHVEADRYFDWVEVEDAPMGIDEAKMKYDLGLIEMAQKRGDGFTYLMVTQRTERAHVRQFFGYSTSFPYQRTT